MAGSLTIGTLSDGTNSTSSTNAIMGSAKAWVNFNGTGTVAIRASYNVSSITDRGVGVYTVNFTNALADANYTPVGSLNPTNADNSGEYTIVFPTGTTSGVNICTGKNVGSQDYPGVFVSIFR